MAKLMKVVGVLALFGVGVGLFAAAYYLYGTDLLRTKWPTTQGEATSQFVGQAEVDGETVYFPSVEYVYQADGQTYSGQRVAPKRPAYSDPAEAEAALGQLVNDWRVTVYYDPADPARAMLDITFDQTPMWGLLAGGAFAVVLGIILAIVLAMAGRTSRPRHSRSRASAAATADDADDNRVPVHDYMPRQQTVGGKPVAPKGSVVTGALFLMAIGAVVAFFGWKDTAKATGDVAWEEVSGRLESSSVHETETYRKWRGMVTTYYPKMQYSYTVNGQSYSSDEISRGDAFYSTYEEAEARLKELSQGRKVLVYYRPSQPEMGYLDVEHYESAVYGQIFVGVFMIIIGLGIIFYRLVILRHIP